MHNLTTTALKYAAGELNAVDSAAFELRLERDENAQEALCEAVRLSAAAMGQPDFQADPLCKKGVQEKLKPTLISRIFARRPYRGHPAAWTAAGAAVAILCFSLSPSRTINDSNTQIMSNQLATVTVSPIDPCRMRPDILGSASGVVREDDKRIKNGPVMFMPELPMIDPMNNGNQDG
jgi:hypothetical protein